MENTIEFREKITDRNKHSREWYVQKAMIESNGKFMIWGGMYLGYRWIPALYVVLSVFYMPLLSYTVYVCIDDFSVISEDVHFILLLGMCFICMCCHLSNRDKLDNIFEAIGRHLYDCKRLLDEKSKKMVTELEKTSESRKNRMKIIFYCGISGAMISLSIFRPLMQYYLSKYIDAKELPPRVNGKKDTFVYYPWNESNTVMNFVGYLSQDMYASITACIVMGSDLVYFNVGETIAMHLEILGVSLRRITLRATSVATKESFSKNPNDTQLSQSLELCLKDAVKHHQAIIKVFNNLREVYFYPLFTLISGATFLLCMAAVIFTSDVPIFSKLTFVVFITAEVLHVFVLCWCGQRILSISADLPFQLYSADWYEFGPQILIYHKMLAIRCSRPMELSAGGFMKMNRNTFLEVLRTAFSYVNLLQATNSRNKVSPQ